MKAGTILVLLALPAMAQEPAAFPDGDFVAGFAVVSKAPARKADTAPPSKILMLLGGEVSKAGRVFLYRLNWTRGIPSTIWKEGQVSVGQRANGDILVGDLDLLSLPELATMTPESLKWIEPKYSKGETEYNGRKCDFYEREMVFDLGEGYVVRSFYKAWIDPESKRPLALDDGTNTYEFRYTDEQPGGPLLMPDFLRAEYNRYMKALKPPPYL